MALVAALAVRGPVDDVLGAVGSTLGPSAGTASASMPASEEAHHRGDDRRTGTDHVLLALLEDPSVEVVLGVTLQQARQALESLDQEALGAVGMGSGADAPPLPMRAVPKKPTIRDVMKKDRLRMTPAAKKVLEEARSSPTAGRARSRASRCWLGVNTSEVRRRLDAVTPVS
jgi:hypothetical protein